jgi:protein-S-isoprenylcysteine O-methyltransferase Ste14
MPAPAPNPSPQLAILAAPMHTGSTAHTQAPNPPPDAMVRLGSWLFTQRSWLPVPIALVLLLVPASSHSPALSAVGLALVVAGETLRFLGVHHIGAISRTRSERLGPLIATGPFGRVRNPLYLGNIALWLGFALSAQLPWIAPLVLLLLAIEYHAIVKWEERLLAGRLGEPYRIYMSRVPRWIPLLHPVGADRPLQGAYSWRETMFSERGTLIAIVVGFLLLAVKNWILGARG